MSLDRIRGLLNDADNHYAGASLENDRARAENMRRHGKRLRVLASDIAGDTQPYVHHKEHGYGVVLGVTKDGQLEVVFGGVPFGIALPPDSVTEVDES
jgi:hypothetical protein